MKTANKQLIFFMKLVEIASKVTNKFDRFLVGGLSFNNLIILYHLSQAQGEMMKRIELADRIGVTPSGITRLLLPMEKLGMLTRQADEHDARVSYVKLASGGKRLLAEALEDAGYKAQDMLPNMKAIGNDLNEVISSIPHIG